MLLIPFENTLVSTKKSALSQFLYENILKNPQQKTLQNSHSVKQKLRHFKTFLWYNKYSFISF